jgi:transketolase
VAECWDLALRRNDGPSALVIANRTLPRWTTKLTDNRCSRGGYVLAEAEAERHATIVATGPDVAVAMAARQQLAAESIDTAVVSLPGWTEFEQQDTAYRAQVLGSAPRIGVEAAARFGWDQWIEPSGIFVGMTEPRATLGPARGPTVEAVVAAVIRRLTEGKQVDATCAVNRR